MRIAIISKSDASGGGASKNAESLARSLRKVGHYVEHHLAYASNLNSDTFLLHQYSGLSRVDNFARGISRSIGLPDLISLDYYIFKRRTKLRFDVVHFHDISGAFSPWNLGLLAKKVPVVWTFHDCSPFTGGCIQPLDCVRYQSRCGQCPQLGLWPLDVQHDRTGILQDIKGKLAKSMTYLPITPSKWLADKAMSSGMFAKRPVVIPHFVESETFRPLQKESVRTVLNLPMNRFLVLIAAGYIHDRFKGMDYAEKALREISDLRPFLLLIGRYNSEAKKFFTGFDCLFTGYISDTRLLAQYFSAADVLLYPTLADNLPNIVIETQSSGTPSIAFATGGVPEIVQHMETGWLAETRDVSGLASGLRIAAEQPEILGAWSNNGRSNALNQFHEDRVMKQHIEIYQSWSKLKANG